MPRFPPLSLGSGHVPEQRLVIKPTYLSILICMGKCLSSAKPSQRWWILMNLWIRNRKRPCLVLCWMKNSSPSTLTQKYYDDFTFDVIRTPNTEIGVRFYKTTERYCLIKWTDLEPRLWRQFIVLHPCRSQKGPLDPATTAIATATRVPLCACSALFCTYISRTCTTTTLKFILCSKQGVDKRKRNVFFSCELGI